MTLLPVAGAPPPASLRQVLSSNRAPPAAPPAKADNTGTSDEVVYIAGRFCRCMGTASMSHNLSNHASTPILSSLVKGGASGGMAGNDVRTLSGSSFNKANVTGIGESLLHNLSLASVAGLVDTYRGPPLSSCTSMPTMERDMQEIGEGRENKEEEEEEGKQASS